MPTTDLLYHLCTTEQWDLCRHRASYLPESFTEEGFIHCSYRHQLLAVANRRFRGHQKLLLLLIDRSKVFGKIVDENLEGGEQLYPHIYGELPHISVVRVVPFPCGPDGSFTLPDGLAE